MHFFYHVYIHVYTLCYWINMYNILCFNKNMMAEVYLIKQHSYIHTVLKSMNQNWKQWIIQKSVKWHNGVWHDEMNIKKIAASSSTLWGSYQSFISPSSSSSSTPRIYRTLLHRMRTSPRLPVCAPSMYSSVLASCE